MNDVCGELEAQILDTMNAGIDFEAECNQDRDAQGINTVRLRLK